VRRYLLVAEWMKILDEQAFPGRAGARGDEAGSAIVAARLAECLLRLCFHLERRYPPYAKWLGSAARQLPGCAAAVAALDRMLVAPDWRARDAAWSEALLEVLALHERHGLLAAGRYRPAPVYLGRPGVGLPGIERGEPSIHALVDELRAGIADPEARALAAALAPA
jgi:hypothetical protein